MNNASPALSTVPHLTTALTGPLLRLETQLLQAQVQEDQARLNFAAALASIPLWLVTGDPLLAVILVSIIDALGFYPTFRKGYHKPDEEALFHYNMAAIKFIIGIMAIENFTWVTVLYPASLVFMNGVFVTMIMWRRHIAKRLISEDH